jgi:hypothetical protein
VNVCCMAMKVDSELHAGGYVLLLSSSHAPRRYLSAGETALIRDDIPVIAFGQEPLIALRHGIDQKIESLWHRAASSANNENGVLMA